MNKSEAKLVESRISNSALLKVLTDKKTDIYSV
jgi:hypothetical protein